MVKEKDNYEVQLICNYFLHENKIDVIYMDFKKAFDSVLHNALLSKLQEMDISDKLWIWLKTYLFNNSSTVCKNWK